MCGRYGFDLSDNIKERFNVAAKNYSDLKPRYNVAPQQKMPVIIKHSPNSVEEMVWWYCPPWPNFDTKRGVINAKSEGVAEKAFFRHAFKSQRCLIPATFFYEWQKTNDTKIPFAIKVKSRPIFAFAGIYEKYINDEGKDVHGFAILTTRPNELMETIHHRMPCILKLEEEEEWINPDNTEAEKLLQLLEPYPANDMEAFPVSTLVNKPYNDTKELLKPLSTDELAALKEGKPKPEKRVKNKVPKGQEKLI